MRASFTNYGAWVDVSAPGVDIYSTYSNHYSATYDFLDGTSMAAPCVMGEVGLLRSRNPGLTRAQVISLITGNVDNIYDENPTYRAARHGAHQRQLRAAGGGFACRTSPNGGEVWYTGESHAITWTSAGVSGNVKIELNRTYPGGAWETLFATIDQRRHGDLDGDGHGHGGAGPRFQRQHARDTRYLGRQFYAGDADGDGGRAERRRNVVRGRGAGYHLVHGGVYGRGEN